jgi:hypothetical protein
MNLDWSEEMVQEFMEEHSQEDFEPGFKIDIEHGFDTRLIPICKPHGDKMYDSKTDTYYCPVCEQ